MPSAPHRWMALVTAEWKSALIERDFRKRGHSFCRIYEDAVWVIQAQSSSTSSALGMKMTVNLGVFLPRLNPVSGWRDEVPEWPSESACHFRTRLGSLMPEKTDLWWTADKDETATALGRQLLPSLLHYGLAALEAVSNAARLRAYWEGGGYGGMTKFQVESYLAALHATN